MAPAKKSPFEVLAVTNHRQGDVSGRLPKANRPVVTLLVALALETKDGLGNRVREGTQEIVHDAKRKPFLFLGAQETAAFVSFLFVPWAKVDRSWIPIWDALT